jgi:protein required for attachment to host cells
MFRAYVVVVDASRARVFAYERSFGPSGLHEQLTESSDLVNPARLGGTSDAHIDRLDAELTRQLTSTLSRLLLRAPARRLILCASPAMLGELRDALDGLRGNDPTGKPLTIDEMPRDLVTLTPVQLRQRLAEYGLLPPLPSRSGSFSQL